MLIGGHDFLEHIVTDVVSLCCCHTDTTQYGAQVSRLIELLTTNGKYTEAQIRQAIDGLATEGHIYSTVDEDHYNFAM